MFALIPFSFAFLFTDDKCINIYIYSDFYSYALSNFSRIRVGFNMKYLNVYFEGKKNMQVWFSIYELNIPYPYSENSKFCV